MLDLSSLHVSYGKAHVLRGLDMHVDRAEIVALLGPNGCGKSTTLKTVAGLVGAQTGAIAVDGTDITRTSIVDRVRRGITLIPQGRMVFKSMTVEENVRLGAHVRNDRDAIEQDLDFWLDFMPVLRERRKRSANELSGGEQRMVSVARGMMSRPNLVLMDEPSLGVAPVVLLELSKLVRRIRDEMNMTVILVEQDVPFALSVADRVCVLVGGRIALEGTPDELSDGTRLKDAYFGRISAPSREDTVE
ncbi:MAG: ABC transporter ATP-binding protein [Ilumatobacteraceae bacterium]